MVRHRLVAVSVALTCAMLAMSQTTAAKSAPIYKMTATVALGSPDRWDIIIFDPVTKRVYVAHGRKISVVDGQNGTLIGTIGTFAGDTQGIGISTATGTGYTDDGEAGVVVPFNLATLKLGTPIPAAPDTDAIVFDPTTNHMLAINGESGSVTVIDPRRNAVVATITAGAELDAGVVDGRGTFFVDGAKNNEVVRISTATNAINAHWALPTCKTPRGIAMDTKARRLFITCANKVMVVVNADTGNSIATLPIGSLSDGAAFDPLRKLAFSSNGDGTLSVVQERSSNTFVSLGTVKTMPGARTMAIDPKTGRLFLAAGDIRRHGKIMPGSLKLLILDPPT